MNSNLVVLVGALFGRVCDETGHAGGLPRSDGSPLTHCLIVTCGAISKMVLALLCHAAWLESNPAWMSPECGPPLVDRASSSLPRWRSERQCSLGSRAGRSPTGPLNSPA